MASFVTPRAPEWIHRLADALVTLETLPARVVDASVVASLLGVAYTEASNRLCPSADYMYYNSSTATMPRKTEWIHRLDDAIAALEAIPAPIVDASALASLLQITPRHARRILGQFFPQPAGRGFVALRADLITHLRTLTAQPDQQHELARRQRVDQQLEAARRDTKARQVLIQPAPQLPTTILDLPAGLLLEPGRLEIRFQTPAELLTHLLSLARAISDDFERFADLGPVTPSETA